MGRRALHLGKSRLGRAQAAPEEAVVKHIVVRAVWDAEAAVWVASSDDIRGLALEAPTVEALSGKLVAAIQDLIEANGLHSDLREIPVEIHAEARTKVLNPCF
jgi:hypothetical protein